MQEQKVQLQLQSLRGMRQGNWRTVVNWRNFLFVYKIHIRECDLHVR